MYHLENVEITLRLIVAVILGLMIGVERERKHQSAGIRTNIIVCVSACILTIIQIELSYTVIRLVLANPDLSGILTTDFSRIVAQIVSGIGFLGAGAIITTQIERVSGLTTAATIWAVVGIGIAVGFGYYFLAVTTTFILVVVLYFLKLITKPGEKYILDITMTNRDQIQEIRNIFTFYNLRTTNEDFVMSRDDKGPIYHLTFTIYIPKKVARSELVTEFLAKTDSIIGIAFKD